MLPPAPQYKVTISPSKQPVSMLIRHTYHKISYDVRFEYNGKYITHLMSPFDKGVNNDCFFRLWSYSDRFDVNRDAAGDSYLFYTSTSDAGRTKVHHMEYVIDLDSKKYDITYTDTSSGYQNTRTGTYTKDMTLDSIRFAVNQNADDWKNGAANGANPGIYWIDNITVEKFGLPEIAAENNDGTITLRADRDVFGVNAYIAGYDSDGKLVSVEKTESFDLSKTGYQITPAKKAAKYGIFVWDMAENKPITMKTEV